MDQMLTDSSTAASSRVEDFFAFARKRHQIYLDRQAGKPEPWTDDPILAKYRFTNVFRELDRVTVWFRENVRDRLRHSPDVLLATVVFRFFNRIRTGETIFNQLDMYTGRTAFDMFREGGDTAPLRAAILCAQSPGPYVTGSYIIKTPEGYDKLDGVLRILRSFYITRDSLGDDWRDYGASLLGDPTSQSIQGMTEWLEKHYYIGWFTAYEVATDLRHTDLLNKSSDILTWANPGPGATRGLNLIMGRDIGKTPAKAKLLDEMRSILKMSRAGPMWPADWLRWEMREVEHTLCEFYKYEKTRRGEGRPRGKFR
jgi:hypothetical protein